MRCLARVRRRVPLGWRLLSANRVRLVLTAAGVGLAVALVLFLTGVYGGVETESNAYVASRPVDVWVAQNNTTNLVRSTSFLSALWIDIVREDSPSTASVAPLLRLITTMTVRGRTFTPLICGIDPEAGATRPALVGGSGRLRRGEIVVDRALARRADLSLGDVVLVQGREHRVSGISAGTNIIVSQLAFLGLEDAKELLPPQFRGAVSFLLVRGKPGVGRRALKDEIRGVVPELNVFTAEEFTRQNLDELRAGLLPILATVALFGTAVAAALVALLLYGTVLEQRETFALLKAVGSPGGFVRRLVLRQGLAAASCGFALGTVVYVASGPLLKALVPVLALSLPWPALVLSAAASLAAGAAGAWLPLASLERIYPGEVFRA